MLIECYYLSNSIGENGAILEDTDDISMERKKVSFNSRNRDYLIKLERTKRKKNRLFTEIDLETVKRRVLGNSSKGKDENKVPTDKCDLIT